MGVAPPSEVSVQLGERLRETYVGPLRLPRSQVSKILDLTVDTLLTCIFYCRCAPQSLHTQSQHSRCRSRTMSAFCGKGFPQMASCPAASASSL